MPDLWFPVAYAFFGTGWIGVGCVVGTMILLRLKDNRVV